MPEGSKPPPATSRSARAPAPRVSTANAHGPGVKASPALVRHAGVAVHAKRPLAPGNSGKAAVGTAPQPAPAPAKPGRGAALRVKVAKARKFLASLPAWLAYWQRYSAWWLRNLPYWLRTHRRLVRKVRKWGIIGAVTGCLWLYFGERPLDYQEIYPVTVQDDARGSTLTLDVTAYMPDRATAFVRAFAWAEEDTHRVYLRLYGRRADPLRLIWSNEQGTHRARVTVNYLKRGVYEILYLDRAGKTRRVKKTEI